MTKLDSGKAQVKKEREKSKEGDAWSSSKRGYDKAEEESSDWVFASN